MMRKAAREPANAQESATLAIRRNMADAVSYLTRIAEEAGMRAVAFKLAGVRVALLDQSAGDPEQPTAAGADPDAARPGTNPNGGTDDRGKLS